MSRLNPATLLDVLAPVAKAIDDQAGIPSMRAVIQRLSMIERSIANLNAILTAPDPVSAEAFYDPLADIDFLFGQPIADVAVKGSVTATSITSTTGTTVVSFNLGPLLAGIPYLVTADTLLASNADPSGFIISLVRIDAAGVNVEGMRTGTASGERSLRAYTKQIVWGDGSSVNIAGRAKTTTGTSSVNDAIVSGEARPLNVMAFT